MPTGAMIVSDTFVSLPDRLHRSARVDGAHVRRRRVVDRTVAVASEAAEHGQVTVGMSQRRAGQLVCLHATSTRLRSGGCVRPRALRVVEAGVKVRDHAAQAEAAAEGDVECPVARSVVRAVENAPRRLCDGTVDPVVRMNHRKARGAAPAALAPGVHILRARRNVENQRVARVRHRRSRTHRRRERHQLELDTARARLDTVEGRRGADDVDVDARACVFRAERFRAGRAPLGVVQPFAFGLPGAQETELEPTAGRVGVPAQHSAARRLESQPHRLVSAKSLCKCV